MFIDEAEIYVRSGDGGEGMVHFHREKYVNRGGPDGGDGGHGGNIVFEVNPHLNTLATFRHQKSFTALNGGKGGTTDKTGKSADDLVIPVPPGTILYNASSGEIVGDLVAAGQVLVVCRGGRGGRGNPHFASSRNQAPRTAERGEPGVEMRLRLELKLIADVGIVGVPNAGKSSFLAAVTNARPKIANYPFTTLEPNLGVAELDLDTNLVLADIPGLIEGAHMGVGLGFAFLRHVQRTRVLIHLLDGLSEDPLADYAQINSEMALFDSEMARKPQIVAFNKMDLPEVKKRFPKIKAALKARGVELVSISAMARTDLTPILWKAKELLLSVPEPLVPASIPVYRAAEDPKAFTIERTEEGWVIHGAAIERSAAMTPWEHDGAVRRFQRMMDFLGVDDALRKAGIEEGDTVFIGDNELEWQD
ncbi:MAG TPA: GTPase ObgE [Anaerolineaceae bacterium]|nr:GTPase ObgE [Anaerolineaceae bacterium]